MPAWQAQGPQFDTWYQKEKGKKILNLASRIAWALSLTLKSKLIELYILEQIVCCISFHKLKISSEILDKHKTLSKLQSII